MTNNDPLDTPFVQHVLRYRPDSVTAKLAREVEELREKAEKQREYLAVGDEKAEGAEG